MRREYMFAIVLTLTFTAGITATQARQTAQPGAVHKQLAARAGEYTTVTKFSAQPGAPTVESTGTARFTMILDGRFLLEEGSGVFMGQQTRSARLWGYDNATKQYESVWIYTGSTGIMRLTGSSSDGGTTVNFAASFNDENGVKQNFDAVLRTPDDDHFVVGLYARGADGSRGPTFDTTYTRKK